MTITNLSDKISEFDVNDINKWLSVLLERNSACALGCSFQRRRVRGRYPLIRLSFPWSWSPGVTGDIVAQYYNVGRGGGRCSLRGQMQTNNDQIKLQTISYINQTHKCDFPLVTGGRTCAPNRVCLLCCDSFSLIYSLNTVLWQI